MKPQSPSAPFAPLSVGDRCVVRTPHPDGPSTNWPGSVRGFLPAQTEGFGRRGMIVKLDSNGLTLRGYAQHLRAVLEAMGHDLDEPNMLIVWNEIVPDPKNHAWAFPERIETDPKES